jgi:polysaccharide export outer membrane protein
MNGKTLLGWIAKAFIRGTFLVALVGCADRIELPALSDQTPEERPFYQIGPGDSLTIFVWKNPDLTTGVTVRPDGRISVPLLEDLDVTGKTPTELGQDIEEELAVFVQDPLVTVIVNGFIGPFSQQVRVVGEAGNPQALAYRANMTLLDVMIEVGGLTEFADGNASIVVRQVDGQEKQYSVRLADLVRDGDISANRELLPGDILIVPESFF